MNHPAVIALLSVPVIIGICWWIGETLAWLGWPPDETKGQLRQRLRNEQYEELVRRLAADEKARLVAADRVGRLGWK